MPPRGYEVGQRVRFVWAGSEHEGYIQKVFAKTIWVRIISPHKSGRVSIEPWQIIDRKG